MSATSASVISPRKSSQALQYCPKGIWRGRIRIGNKENQGEDLPELLVFVVINLYSSHPSQRSSGTSLHLLHRQPNPQYLVLS